MNTLFIIYIISIFACLSATGESAMIARKGFIKKDKKSIYEDIKVSFCPMFNTIYTVCMIGEIIHILNKK